MCVYTERERDLVLTSRKELTGRMTYPLPASFTVPPNFNKPISQIFFFFACSSVSWNSAVLFRMTHAFLGKMWQKLVIRLVWWCGRHLGNKIIQICWLLDASWVNLMKMTEAIQGQQTEVNPLNNVIWVLSFTTYVLHLCPTWLVKAVREATESWIRSVVSASLGERIVLPLLKKKPSFTQLF